MREDRLAGLETPGGIRGGPAAVDAEDAPNGDSAQEAGLPELRPLQQQQAVAAPRCSCAPLQWGAAAAGSNCRGAALQRGAAAACCCWSGRSYSSARCSSIMPQPLHFFILSPFPCPFSLPSLTVRSLETCLPPSLSAFPARPPILPFSHFPSLLEQEDSSGRGRGGKGRSGRLGRGEGEGRGE